MPSLLHAGRRLLKRPSVLLTAVLSLSLGIGLTSVLLGVVDDLLIQAPPHVREPHEIVRLYYSHPEGASASRWASFPMYQLLRDRMTDLVDLAAHAPKRLVMGRGEGAREITTEFVTPNYFSVLGLVPAKGRFFRTDEESVTPGSTVVLSHGLWQSAFAGSGDVLGMPLHIGDRALTIVGVAPKGFSGIDHTRVDAWMPVTAASAFLDPAALTAPTLYWVHIFGRLATGTASRVSREATAVLTADGPLTGQNASVKVTVGPVLAEGGPVRSFGARLTLWLSAASAILLLIAWANVATLMLVQVLSRTHELATRSALGASRGQLVQEVLVDTGIVTGLGALLATVVVHWTGTGARALLVPGLELVSTPMDLRGAWQIVGITLLTGAACAVAPVLFVATTPLVANPVIQVGAPSPLQRTAGAALVAVQGAATVVLLIGAGLFSRSLKNVASVDVGMDADRVLYASATVRANLARPDMLALYHQLSDRVAEMPGVEGATVALGLPLRSVWAVATTLPVDVWSGPNPVVLGHAVGPDYFAITGLRVTRGRAFESSEHLAPDRVAIINEAFASVFGPTQNPLGACLRLGSDKACTRVVGVAANTPRWSVTADREFEVYIPISRTLAPLGSKETIALAIRARDDPESLIVPIRRTIQAASPLVEYAAVTPVRATLASQLRPWRVGTVLFSSFGLIALVLAAVGVYGLLAFLVARERRAIGTRMALGASPSAVWRSVAARGATLCAFGAVLGALGAAVLAPVGQSFVFGLSVRDPLVFGASVCVVVVTGLVASLAPARRAAKLDPASLLRVH